MLAAAAKVEDEEAPPAPTWPRVIKLLHPIDFGSERVTSLEFRRGKLGDLKGISLGDTVPTAHLVLIAARLTGKTTHVIELLDMDDSGEVMGIALDFYGKCLAAGKKP